MASLATGSNKTANNSYEANGRVYAGYPCLLSHNASPIARYARPNTYLDIVKGSETWREPSGSMTLDADGWITAMTGSVFKLLMASADTYEIGSYTIEFDGTATLSIQDRTLVTVTGSKDNNFTFDLPDIGDTNFQIWAIFNGGTVSNLRCYLTADKAALDSGQVFKQSFIDFFIGNKSIRFMDLMGTNGSPNRHHVVADNSETQVKNMSPESIASLANATGCIPWVCRPVLSTDAYWTTFLTRLHASLDPLLKVKVEFGNETWNTYGVIFQEAWTRMLHGAMPLQDATYDTATTLFTQVAHGHATGTLLITHNTFGNHLSRPFSGAGNLYLINVSADTFRVAVDEAAAIAGTVLAVPAGLTDLVYSLADPAHTPTPNYDLVQENTALSALNSWAIADGIFGRGRVIHTLCGQSGNAGVTNRLMAVPNVVAQIDGFNIAPYAHYNKDVDGNDIDWYNETNAQLLQRLKDNYPKLKEQIQSHRQYLGNTPLGAYEAGNEDPWELTELEEARVENFWFSSDAFEFFPSYGEMLAQSHIREVSFYISHGGSYGTQWGLDRPDTPKYISAQPFWSVGFNRGLV